MILTYIVAMLIILGMLAGWLAVQHLSRSFAERHPEFDGAAEEGGACGMFCFCKNRMTCPKQKLKQLKNKEDGEAPHFNQ